MSMFDGKNVTETIVRQAPITSPIILLYTLLVYRSTCGTYCYIPYSMYRFYHTNQVKRFMLKRPFHRGKKDKENEYKVDIINT